MSRDHDDVKADRDLAIYEFREQWTQAVEMLQLLTEAMEGIEAMLQPLGIAEIPKPR